MAITLPVKTLTVVVTFEAKPGKEAEVRAALAGLLTPTRKEPGCLKYEAHQSTESPGKFLFYEIWQDQAALDAHMKSRHVMSLLPLVDKLCVEFPHPTFWRKIEK